VSILSFFSGTPRSEQAAVLLELEATWDRWDVFVLRMPVGAGKSRVAHCISAWLASKQRSLLKEPAATILTPTNVLVNQYLDDWPDLPTIKRINTYPSRAAYETAKSVGLRAPMRVLNYYSYLAHRAYAPCVVVDEAHNLVPFLQNMEALNIWPHLLDVPDWVRTTDQLAGWAQSDGRAKTAKLAAKLAQHPDTYVVERVREDYRGHERDCIKLLPLTPRNNRPILWPGRRVKKLVFMSATFHQEDLYDLGLEGRRVKIIDCGSPIPPDRRPIVYAPVGSLGAAHRSRTMPDLVEGIQRLLAKHPERGVIHTTYAMARELRAGSLGGADRLVWHGHANKDRVFREWLANPGGTGDGRVLVACGFAEGIDLAGDRARWQGVTKLLYPDRSDTAVAAKAALRPDWYAWMAAKTLQQTVGRVSRGPMDFGVTYVLTSEFGHLYARNRDMFPESFNQSLEFGQI
jgi:Rad3-related DNA helicase